MKRAIISVALVGSLVAGTTVAATPAMADPNLPIWKCSLVGQPAPFRITNYSQCPWGVIYEYSTKDLALHGTIHMVEGAPYGSNQSFLSFLEGALLYSVAKAKSTVEDAFKSKLWNAFKQWLKSSKSDPELPPEFEAF